LGSLQFGMVGFDITPRLHPQFGAWGTTAGLTKIDLPLLGRCVVLDQGGLRLIWFGMDLIGQTVSGTNKIRGELAEALGLKVSQIIWSTSQTHSSGALPGSNITGSSIADLSRQDSVFANVEHRRFSNRCIDAAQEAISRLQAVKISSGAGFCDSMCYNRRLPTAAGGVKFSRDYKEGIRNPKPFDTTIGLLRFENKQAETLGAIFNFGCHPATMIDDCYVSPDWVGTARQYVQDAIGGAPAMFVQGFLGDVLCYHIFGGPAQAKQTGARLGQAAAKAMDTLVPVKGELLSHKVQAIDLPCRPMYGRRELDDELNMRHSFIKDLQRDPHLTWCGGINFPEQFSAEQKSASVNLQIDYLEKGLEMLAVDQRPSPALSLALGVIRIGNLAAVYAPGEIFTAVGMQIRHLSSFDHMLVCGDTNGLLGYIGNDEEIDRGGYETDTFWKMVSHDGFRLAPGKGTADRIVKTSLELLENG